MTKRLSALLRLALASLCLAFSISIATAADYVIKKDLGGNPVEYWQKYVSIRDTGVRIVIDGICGSGCTIVLQVIPRDRICVTKNASLAFHAAKHAGTEIIYPEGTRVLRNHYPSDVRQWIDEHKALDSLKPTTLQGPALEAMIKPCVPTKTSVGPTQTTSKFAGR